MIVKNKYFEFVPYIYTCSNLALHHITFHIFNKDSSFYLDIFL